MVEIVVTIIGERAKRVRHYQCVQIRADVVYIYGCTCAIIVAHAIYPKFEWS